MLDVVLQVLSVVGIILLILLGLLLAVILVVLFFPITYRVSGEKEGKSLSLDVKANWLFGLIRARFVYPEPGKLTVKALWITVFDPDGTGEDQPGEAPKEGSGKAERDSSEAEHGDDDSAGAAGMNQSSAEAEERSSVITDESSKEIQDTENEKTQEAHEAGQFREIEDTGGDDEQPVSQKGSQILKKFTKIKYTFRDICDKIKRIWQNITYYAELLQDWETRLLFLHVKSRVWKLLKSIRPRKLKAQILFGTGSPDTTGYAYGVYGMLLPLLGPNVMVTPDFCQAVLEGSFYAAGHVTVAVLLWHVIWVLCDKRLWRFKSRLSRSDQNNGDRNRDNEGHKGSKHRKNKKKSKKNKKSRKKQDKDKKDENVD